MKKFFVEFKTFITRGNVLDMAVGVIVGGAFTAIVNGLSNFVLKPLINWVLALIMGAEGLSGVITPLSMAYVLDETGAKVVDPETGAYIYDLANSIYIDWGSLISAIINFIITALVLFIIVKIINKAKEEDPNKVKLTKEQKLEMKAEGINLKDKEAVQAWLDKKKAEEEAKKAEEEAAAAEAARLEREANPTAEDLLKKIVVLLEEKK